MNCEIGHKSNPAKPTCILNGTEDMFTMGVK